MSDGIDPAALACGSAARRGPANGDLEAGPAANQALALVRLCRGLWIPTLFNACDVLSFLYG
jgi:hypothetical protein